MPPAKNLFSTVQWLAGAFVLFTFLLSVVAFAFQNFESKGDAKDFKTRVEMRLDRIEEKIDRILTSKR